MHLAKILEEVNMFSEGLRTDNRHFGDVVGGYTGGAMQRWLGDHKPFSLWRSQAQLLCCVCGKSTLPAQNMNTTEYILSAAGFLVTTTKPRARLYENVLSLLC